MHFIFELTIFSSANQMTSSFYIDTLFFEAALSSHGLQVQAQLVFVHAPRMMSPLVDSRHPSARTS